MMTTVYKTDNFTSPTKWFKRVALTSFVMFWVFLFVLADFQHFGLNTLVIVIFVYLFIIVSGQFDELAITKSEIIIEKKSLVPFLRSKRFIKFDQIHSLKKNSDFIHGSGWNYFDKVYMPDHLEVNLQDGSCVLISDKLHPHGIKGLIKIIEKQLNKS